MAPIICAWNMISSTVPSIRKGSRLVGGSSEFQMAILASMASTRVLLKCVEEAKVRITATCQPDLEGVKYISP